MKRFKNILKFVEAHEGLLFVLLVVAVLRIPSLFEPNRYGDEDIYLTLGMGLKRGLVFYRDIHDNKPPLLYLLAAVSGSVVWFRLILLAWNGINIVLINALAKRLIKNPKTVFLTTALFGLLGAIPLIEGNIANGEIFMIMPTTAAVLLMLAKQPKSLAVGFLFAAAFLFKVPVVFEVVGLLIWVAFYKARTVEEALRGLLSRQAWMIGVGFLVPIIISVAYYYMMGAGEAYVRAALMQNVGYVSSWENKVVIPIYRSGLVVRGVVWLFSIGVIFWQRKYLKEKFGLVALWFGGALYGALLSGRPYPHYMIEILPPLVLMVGMVIGKYNVKKMKVAGMFLGLSLFSLVYYKYWYYPTLGYYENFVRYATGNRSEADYRNWFGWGVNRNYQIADYIKSRTFPNDKIYVFGTEPAIYVLADRLPVGRYTVAYHVNDFAGQDETMKAIESNPPAVVVTFKDQGTDFGQLWGFLRARYTKTTQFDDAGVWLLKKQS